MPSIPRFLARTGLPVVLAATAPAAACTQADPAAVAPPSNCLAADQRSNHLISELRDWVTTTDPWKLNFRDTHFRIPVVPVQNITLVPDNNVCTKASKAYASLTSDPTPGPVYVVKMVNSSGTWYVVSSNEPLPPDTEFRNYLIFDSRWSRYGGWAG